MSNEFFQHSNRFVPGTKVKADEANNKFDALEQGFNKLPTEQQLKSGNLNYAVDTGTANNYAVALPYAPAGYFDGLSLAFRAGNANTGSSVLNVNGLGNKSILLPNGSPVGAGDIPAGGVVSLVYGAGSFQFQGTSLSATATAVTKAGEASASATSATSSKNAAATSATAAASSATAAASSATAAASSATNAANSATSASTRASAAATSAANAANSAVQAEQVAAGNVFDDTQVLGTKGWSSSKINAEYVKQTTPIDAAAGALMLVGAGGLLSSGGNVFLGSLDALTTTQFVRCGATATGGPPGLSIDGSTVIHQQHSGGYASQEFTHTFGGKFDRVLTGGVWQPWKRVISSRNELIAGSAGVFVYKYPAGGVYNTNFPDQTGTLKITLPFSWSDTMMWIKIRGYDYRSDGAAGYELVLAGYPYAPSATWINVSAQALGPHPFTGNVRFGHDGTKACILLGTTTTTLQYPKVVIEEVITGFVSANLAWESGWSVSQIASESGITITRTADFNGGEYGSNANGLYVRFANGWQKSWRFLDLPGAALNTGAYVEGPWAASFISPPSQQYSVVAEVGDGGQTLVGLVQYNGVYGSPTAANAVLQMHAYRNATNYTTNVVRFYVEGIGRWY